MCSSTRRYRAHPGVIRGHHGVRADIDRIDATNASNQLDAPCLRVSTVDGDDAHDPSPARGRRPQWRQHPRGELHQRGPHGRLHLVRSRHRGEFRHFRRHRQVIRHLRRRGHLKTMLILGFGFAVVGDPIVAKNVFGLRVALCGMFVYARAEMRDRAVATTSPPFVRPRIFNQPLKSSRVIESAPSAVRNLSAATNVQNLKLPAPSLVPAHVRATRVTPVSDFGVGDSA